MKRLLIVESPNKRKTINKYLGEGWCVEASKGHFCDLPPGELGVTAPEYQPSYLLSDSGKQVINKLKVIAKNSDEVWLATDPDREGEAIAKHLARELKLQSPKRVVFNELTEKAVQEAIKNPKEVNENLFLAQQARRVADRLIGWMVSPRLSDLAGQRLSAGRVQSVAVRLLHEREQAIASFVPTMHFGVKLLFVTEGVYWSAVLDREPFYVSEDEPYILDKEVALAAAKAEKLEVQSVKFCEHKQKAPAPFITTSLQKAASITLNLSAQETMDLAQKLFEAGNITYHRTDNPNLSDDGIEAVQQQLMAEGHQEHIAEKANKWRAKEGSQEAHEAIRPTDMSLATVSLEDDNAGKLYELIRVRALACQLKQSITKVTEVRFIALDLKVGDKTPEFVAKSSELVYQGWRLLTAVDQSSEDSEDDEGAKLPSFTENQVVSPDRPELLELKTSPPKRYTEPSLITRLENEGIGRPSTYANILANIENRGYATKSGKSYHAHESAKFITESLTGKFDFMELEYTRKLEESLDKIANQETSYKEVVAKIDTDLRKNLNALAVATYGALYSCTECQAPMRKIKSKKNDKYFWGCTRFNEGCKFSVPDKDGKPNFDIKKIDSGEVHTCPKCSRKMYRIQGKTSFFWGCSGFKEGCKTMLPDNNGKPGKIYHCHKCKREARRKYSEKTGGHFWYCTGFEEGCKQFYSDNYGQPIYPEELANAQAS